MNKSQEWFLSDHLPKQLKRFNLMKDLGQRVLLAWQQWIAETHFNDKIIVLFIGKNVTFEMVHY